MQVNIRFQGPWEKPITVPMELSKTLINEQHNIHGIKLFYKSVVDVGVKDGEPEFITSLDNLPVEYCPRADVSLDVFTANDGENNLGKITIKSDGSMIVKANNDRRFKPTAKLVGLYESELYYM